MRKFCFLSLFYCTICLANYEVNCLPQQDLDAQIQFCGENTLAAEAAEACQLALANKWAEAGPELKAILSQAEHIKNTKQKNEIKFSVNDLEKTQSKLQHLIDMTEDNMLILASYPAVMPDRRSENDLPVPCYEDNFARVEKVVRFLDNKIFELENAEEIAYRMREISLGNEINIENHKSLGIRSPVLKSQNMAANAKGTTLSGSTITETTRKKLGAPPSSFELSNSQKLKQAAQETFSKVSNQQGPEEKKINSESNHANDPAWIKTVIDQYGIENGK